MLATCVTVFLLLFLVWPVAVVVLAALGIGGEGFTLGYLRSFFDQALYRDAFLNSMRVALSSVAGASLIAVPLAWIAVRLQLRAGWPLQLLGILPLIMPPFVAAFSLQPILGNSGVLNLLLERRWDIRLSLMEGTNGVILVESIHYFPFILLNLMAALRRVDLAMEESALTLGGRSARLFWRIIVPLALPGYLAGAAIVFIRAFEDLGTPLVLGVTNLLAPLTYLRVTTNGIDDALSYVIALIMLLFSALTWWCIVHLFRDRVQAYMPYLQGGQAHPLQPVRNWPGAAAAFWIAAVALVVLMPYLGLLALSMADIWSFSILPDSWTFRHFSALAPEAGDPLFNTLLYGGVAAIIDVVLAMVLAHLVLRSQLRWRRALELLAGAALAVPGLVLALGYLRMSREMPLSLNAMSPLVSSVGMTMAYAVQQLPYALMACMVALRAIDPAMEEAAASLGSSRWRALRRVRLPLMAGGIALGAILSFMVSATELSIAMLLCNAEEQAPLSYEIYLNMQSVSGRGAGAALGMVAIAALLMLTAGLHALLKKVRNAASGP
ncbi:iron ABC transporter permease [Herbaspirillum sp. YR522]|uniref:ABC transporter permease n=1 Tax=Herbaspirillum sp. YR522 TaxID=1144342 RepID=UPI00138AC91C|nr:iron ABC transporter permease [Herbaspirillum sp. YR522]